MYINSIGHYLPERIVDNKYFKDNYDLEEDWIIARSGIKRRHWAAADENTNTMIIKAIDNALEKRPFDIKDIDLIVSATYSPFDLSVSIAHAVQHHYQIDGAKALSVNSGCSSYINAMEVAEAMIKSGKAEKVLVCTSEHNTGYVKADNPTSAHFLWGDGAAVAFVTKEKIDSSFAVIKEVCTMGLGNVSNSSRTVNVHPLGDGIGMPYGKDVFINACKYMPLILTQTITPHNLELKDLNYIITHQANLRIINNIATKYDIKDEQLLTNIEECGNTGSSSTMIVFSMNEDKYKSNDLIGFTVFGGGYSTAAMLVNIL